MKTLMLFLLSLTAFSQEYTIVVYKNEEVLQLFKGPSLVKEYPVCAMGTRFGPKQRQGDMMTPEGVYSVTQFNPHSQYLLSMRVSYPNAYDLKHRMYPNLGGDIYIHGSCCTAGCIAITDSGITDLYKRCIGHRVKVLIFPTMSPKIWDKIQIACQQEDSPLIEFYQYLRPLWEAWTRSIVWTSK